MQSKDHEANNRAEQHFSAALAGLNSVEVFPPLPPRPIR